MQHPIHRKAKSVFRFNTVAPARAIQPFPYFAGYVITSSLRMPVLSGQPIMASATIGSSHRIYITIALAEHLSKSFGIIHHRHEKSGEA